VKLAVIGAGSTYTPELVSGLSALDVDELALHDIADERREIVGGLARRMLDRVGYRGGLETTGGRVSAVVTEKGTIRTQSVLLSGGAWSSLFCRRHGIELPIGLVNATACRTIGVSGPPGNSTSARRKAAPEAA